MENQKTENVLTAAARLLFVILLILLLIFLFGTLSTGWLGLNRDVNGNGMGVGADGIHLEKITVTDVLWERNDLVHPKSGNTWPDAQALLPGDTVTVTVELKTRKTSEAGKEEMIRAEFAVQTPPDTQERASDVPVTVNGANYYLSSQMELTKADFYTVDAAGQEQPLNPYPESGGKSYNASNKEMLSDHRWGSSSKASPKEIDLGTAKLKAGDTYRIRLVFTFKDDPKTNQTVLRGNEEHVDLNQNVIPSSFRRIINVNELLR